MPLLPSALPPKGEARRYVANDFLNLIAFPSRGRWPEGADRAGAVWKTDGIKSLIPSHSSPVTPPTSPFSHVLSHAIIGKIHAFVAQLDRAAVS